MSSHKSETERLETRKVCEQILEEARKLTNAGHVIVITNAEDKSDLSVARELADALGIVCRKVEERKPTREATPSGKRLTAL